MKMERLQKYKQDLASSASNKWGEILFRLVTEARNDRGDDDKRELEDTKLKLTIALGALEVYADQGSFSERESPDEIAHLAQITLEKIKKVNWLTENRPAELR